MLSGDRTLADIASMEPDPKHRLIGGPFDGKSVPIPRGSRTTYVGNDLYVAHIAVHPQCNTLRKYFYFHKETVWRNSPILLNAIADWLIAVKPRGRRRKPKRP